MKYERISYQRIFTLPQPFENVKMGIELIIEPGETAMDGYRTAKKIVEDSFNDIHADAIKQFQAQEIPIEPPIPEDKRISAIVSDIRTCKEVKVLESYRLIAKSNPELQAAYDQKMQELTPKK